MKFGVVTFPGSNCDYDSYMVVKDQLGKDVEFIWHKDSDVSGFDCIVLPGGFSYGDYLRTGAIARYSPVMGSVIEYANNGGLVIGICNGFQILLESGLLPGAMLRNRALRFIHKSVYLRCENTETPFRIALRSAVFSRFLSLTPTATTTRIRRMLPSWSVTSRSYSVTVRQRVRLLTPLTRTAVLITSPVSATKRAMFSA